MRACHIRDGAALTEYFAWLENELVNKKTVLDEVDAADKLEQIRTKHELFAGLSFDTISSTGPNGAVIHYKPEKGSCSIIDPTAIYLCDSGCQYLDGTTDTTRTFHFGQPTEFEKQAFTLVLKGLIGIAPVASLLMFWPASSCGRKAWITFMVLVTELAPTWYIPEKHMCNIQDMLTSTRMSTRALWASAPAFSIPRFLSRPDTFSRMVRSPIINLQFFSSADE